MSLDSTPASDTIQATTKIWIADLWAIRAWQEDDHGRIAQAFRTLRTTRQRWPSMADFLAAVPKREEKPALPAKILSEAERQANMQRIQDLIDSMTVRHGEE